MDAFTRDTLTTGRITAPPDLDLSWLLRTLWREKAAVILALLLGLGLARVMLAFSAETYVASAVLVLQLQPPGVFRPNSVFSGTFIDEAMVESQVEVLGSAQILTKVSTDLYLLDSPEVQPNPVPNRPWWLSWLNRDRPVSEKQQRLLAVEQLRRQLEIERIGVSNAIRLSFRSEDPERAARIVNKIAEVYVRGQLARQLTPEESLPFENGIIVTRAAAPTQPSGPPRLLIYGGAALISGFIGAGIAMLRQWLKDDVRTPAELETLLRVPCLAVLPRMDALENETVPAAVRPTRRPRSFSTEHFDELERGHDGPAFGEALRRVVVPLREMGDSQRCMVFGVVSQLRGEGRSVLAVAVARLLSRMDGPTLLVDCDLRGGGLSAGLGAGEAGLTEVISGTRNVASVLWREGADLVLMPAGSLSAHNPADLIGSSGMAAMIDAQRAEFQHIVLDLPPLSRWVDARAAAQLVDAFLLVAECGRARKREIRRSLHQSGPVERKVIATVLNKYKPPYTSQFAWVSSLRAE